MMNLIFSGSNLVAVYDEKTGDQIVGKENIIREIQRRRKQCDEWIREGKMENTFDEIHHTDDGWTSNVRFTAYPNKLHPKEVKAETNQLINLAAEKRKNQLGIEGGISEVSADAASNKKPKTEEKRSIIEISTSMDIDQPETSTSKGQKISPIVTGQNPKTNWENSELLSDVGEQLFNWWAIERIEWKANN